MKVIEAKGLCKSYPLYATNTKRFVDAFKPIKNLPRFHALNDITFSLDKGDTLGVLGINGSGKSTLLKMLAGVTKPSSGELNINGRVGALLELGAGFNPDFTGLENAKMALKLAGFNGSDAANELENAIAFADIGEFVSMPVKLYSSGMFVRLAFACATSSRPDILLIDEALSVGDLFFQAKCIERMKGMLKNGTSLVFVSHDISAVKSICSRCILLNGGRQECIGKTEEVARRYFSLKFEANEPESFAACEIADTIEPDLSAWDKKVKIGRIGDGRIRFDYITLMDNEGHEIEGASFGQEVILHMAVTAHCDLPEVCIGYHVQNSTGVDIIYSDTAIEGCNMSIKRGERKYIDWHFNLKLGEGSHNIAAVLSIPRDMRIGEVEFCDYIHTAVQFSMLRRDEAKIYSLAYWENEVKIYA